MTDLIAAYPSLIGAIVDAFHATHAEMHIHAGLAIYLLVQLVTRERRGSMIALNVVFAAEMGNELMDRLAYGSWRWGDTASDVLLTMLWPVAITVVSQIRRAQYRRDERARLLAGATVGA